MGFPKTAGWFLTWTGSQRVCIYGLGRHSMLYTSHLPDFSQSLLEKGHTNILILQKRKQETQRVNDLSKVGPGLQLHLSYAAIHVQVPEGELRTPVCFLLPFSAQLGLEAKI